jgi:hypothetical protein
MNGADVMGYSTDSPARPIGFEADMAGQLELLTSAGLHRMAERAERLRHKRLVSELDQYVLRCQKLQRIIDDAPHDPDCACGTMMNVEEFFPCSCWKAEVR